VQYRAHGDVARARVREAGGARVRVRFDRPVEAVAPGQSAVFYAIDGPREVLGGGYVASTRGARDVA
jgi:tRNA-uridine 2-sulfurtransferase